MAAICTHCGQRVRTVVPAGGDGSGQVLVRHRLRDVNRRAKESWYCKGSRQLVRSEDLLDDDLAPQGPAHVESEPVPPSPWQPARSLLGCCVDRQYGKGCDETTCMHLPIVGQTCSDCTHVERCTKMFGQDPDDTSCQFFPRRFNPRVNDLEIRPDRDGEASQLNQVPPDSSFHGALATAHDHLTVALKAILQATRGHRDIIGDTWSELPDTRVKQAKTAIEKAQNELDRALVHYENEARVPDSTASPHRPRLTPTWQQRVEKEGV